MGERTIGFEEAGKTSDKTGPSGDRIWFCINIDNLYLRPHLGDVEPKAGSWRKSPSGTHADWLP